MNFENLVAKAIKAATKDSEGKWTFDTTDEAVQYAAMAEIRRRETQAAYTKAQQQLTTVQKEADILFNRIGGALQLTDEQQAELDDLKTTDLDKWRKRINQLEADQQSNRNTVRDQIKQQAQQETEQERRARLIAEWNEANPNSMLTDDFIDNDLPPRLLRQLESNEIEFDTFLEKASRFASGKVTLKGTDVDESTAISLGGKPGGATPEDAAAGLDSASTYATETY